LTNTTQETGRKLGHLSFMAENDNLHGSI